YSTDVLIGLQPEGVGEGDFDVNRAKQADPRHVEAVILKNRNGRTGSTLEFSYSPAFNLFMGAGTKDHRGNDQLPPFNPEEAAELDQQGRLTGTKAFYSAETAKQVTRK